MLIKIGLENNNDGRSIAWALDFPGCYAYGKDGPEAVLGIPRALLDYQAWIGRHTSDSWLADLGDFDVRLVETFDCYGINASFERSSSPEDYMVESFYLHDWKPLTAEDVRRALLLFEWSRADLLDSFAGLNPAQMDTLQPGERWPVNGILNHVGGAEWWYMDNIGLAGIPQQDLSKVPTERLAQVRTRLNELLPTLVGAALVVGKEGELWSPRKMLRRAIWHELDHVGHIRRLAQMT